MTVVVLFAVVGECPLCLYTKHNANCGVVMANPDLILMKCFDVN